MLNKEIDNTISEAVTIAAESLSLSSFYDEEIDISFNKVLSGLISSWEGTSNDNDDELVFDDDYKEGEEDYFSMKHYSPALPWKIKKKQQQRRRLRTRNGKEVSISIERKDYIEELCFCDEVLVFEDDKEEEDIFSSKHYSANTTSNKKYQRRKREQQRENPKERNSSSRTKKDTEDEVKKVANSPVQKYKKMMKQFMIPSDKGNQKSVLVKQNSFKFEKDRQPRRRSLVSRAA